MKKPLNFFGIVCIASMLSLSNLTSCKKENIVPEVGKSYHIKGNIFNKGSYQPKQPVLVDSLYTDPLSGLPYALVRASINWDEFALTKRSGVADQTIEANKIMIKNLSAGGIEFGDQIVIGWEMPIADLK